MALAVVAAAISCGIRVAAADEGQCGTVNGWAVEVAGLATCDFAFNVARGLSPTFSGNSTTFSAYSPVTHLTYSVNCWRKYQLVLECNAGNNAIVYLVS